MKRALIVLLLLSLAVAAEDRKESITLLALIENGTGQSGGVAKLSLELKDGAERVFLETFPMTKVTTQASLRFAQQVACRELGIDCSDFDFLFTIESLPGIVGGPSAGSAATFVTAAVLLNKSIPSDVAMSGSINSGGIIGPVGGLKYKIEAAGKSRIKRVYIPKGTGEFKENNKTIDLIEHGRLFNVSVLEAATIQEIWELELGVVQKNDTAPFVIDDRYARVMSAVATDLCDRSKAFEKISLNDTKAKNFTERASKAVAQGEYYSAASYCFRANVEYKQEDGNASRQVIEKRLAGLKADIKTATVFAESHNVSTMTDLQTFMAVMERLGEATDTVDDVAESLKRNKTAGLGSALGYAEERLFSGLTWARFFGGHDRFIVIDEAAIKRGCAAKISEAEERYNYVKSIIPEALDGTRDDIDKSYSLLRDGKFSMCLYTAAKAKAEADVLLSLMGVEDKRLNESIDLKLEIAKKALVRAQEKDVFPIIAYSYFEYANSLREFDTVSALLFGEYALELANLDMYFVPQKVAKKEVVKFSLPDVPPVSLAFGIGILVGGLFIGLAFRLLSSREVQTLQAPPKRRLRGKKR